MRRRPRSAICVWLSLSFCSDASSAVSSAAIWRRSAEICWLSSSTWASARWLICFSEVEVAVERCDLVGRRGRGGRLLVEQAAQAVALAFCRAQARLQGAEIVGEFALAGALQSEHLGQFGDLGVELLENGVLARDFARQQELHQREDRQQEDEHQQQVGQNVDKARPVLGARDAATAAGHGHGYSPGVGARRARAMVSSSDWTSRCCSDWVSTQLRMTCCSLRMCWTRP